MQILYAALSAQINAALNADFWQPLKNHGLPTQAACYSDEKSLLARLADCKGRWRVLLLDDSDGAVAALRLDNQIARRLLALPALHLSQAVYRWQPALSPGEQAQALARLAQREQAFRPCLPCDVEFDPEWSSLPPYRYRLLLCNGARCARRGSARLWKLLAETLAQRGLLETSHGALLVKTHCQFPCNHGPIVTVYPGEYWYCIRQPQEVERLVSQHLQAGQPAEELLLDLPLLSRVENK